TRSKRDWSSDVCSSDLATVVRIGPTEVRIVGSTIGSISVEYEYIKKIRASYYLLGALLGKYKNAEVPLPGGCNIGSRPIDLHLKIGRAARRVREMEGGV